jgi:hypothetical protein
MRVACCAAELQVCMIQHVALLCRKKFQEPITLQLFSSFAESLKKEKAKENLPGNLGFALITTSCYQG